MALTHHVLVRLAAYRKGFEKFSHYMIIGDDVVIFNEQVAEEYLKILDHIGVQTDPIDSILPNDSHPFEIGKRLFRNGLEVSPIPLNLRKSLALFFLVMRERGFQMKSERFHPVTTLRSQCAANLLLLVMTTKNWLIAEPSRDLDPTISNFVPTDVHMDSLSTFDFGIIDAKEGDSNLDRVIL